MGLLSLKDRESLAAEVFLKTGVPLSKEDPIFALVEILKSTQAEQEASFDAACYRAVDALNKAVDHMEDRTAALKSLVDTYIEHRLEAANAMLDQDALRLGNALQESLIQTQEDFRALLKDEIQRLGNSAYDHASLIGEPVIMERSWIENLWTLAACLAMGFAVGLIYFNGTIREPLLSQLERVTSRLPSPPAPTKH